MPVRRPFVTGLAVLALLCGGCGGNGNTVAADETNDPVYQQAQDLKKQGRYNEALNAFLKEIDRRGENGAPESHLEAGALYLNWSHNPVEAYHHFSKYLELQPTGPRAAIVRGQRDAAMREIARYLLAPANGQSTAGADQSDELDRLRREVAELKAENQTLRGASSVPAVRSTPMIALPEDNGANATRAEPDQVTPASAPPPNDQYTHALTPTPSPPPAAVTPAPVRPTRAAAPVAAAPTRPAGSARWSHTVAPGEKSLWGIARKYYPSVNQARVNAIFEANRETMRSPNDLRVGMVLRIP